MSSEDICDYSVNSLPVNVSWCFSLDALLSLHEGSGFYVIYSFILLEQNEYQ